MFYRPWGYKFRKARYVYVPEEEQSCKSVEMERIMREARLREMMKGVYRDNGHPKVRHK